MSGELEGAATGDAGAATSEPPGSYRSQQSSSDAESQSTAYTPAAASAPAGLAASSADDVAADGAAGAGPKAADAESPPAEADTTDGAAAAAAPESPVPGLAVRRTTSTTRMNSVSGSEGGRWAASASVRLPRLVATGMHPMSEPTRPSSASACISHKLEGWHLMPSALQRRRRTHRSSEPWHPSTNDWNVQIEKDLHRTFPGHPLMNRSGRGALRRILAAYSRRNEAVGYCQVLLLSCGCCRVSHGPLQRCSHDRAGMVAWPALLAHHLRSLTLCVHTCQSSARPADGPSVCCRA
jgi:Rab-GTPase-TBC domain